MANKESALPTIENGHISQEGFDETCQPALSTYSPTVDNSSPTASPDSRLQTAMSSIQNLSFDPESHTEESASVPTSAIGELISPNIQQDPAVLIAQLHSIIQGLEGKNTTVEQKYLLLCSHLAVQSFNPESHAEENVSVPTSAVDELISPNTQQDPAILIAQLQATVQGLESKNTSLHEDCTVLNRRHTASKHHAGKTFPLFSLLPAEIRLMIWRISCHAPRVLMTRAHSPVRFSWHCSTPPPPVIHACHESRTEAMKAYTMLRRVDPTDHTSSRLYIGYFNFDVDILWIVWKGGSYGNMLNLPELYKLLPEGINQFPRLAFSFEDAIEEICIIYDYESYAFLCSVPEIILVLNAPQEHDDVPLAKARSPILRDNGKNLVSTKWSKSDGAENDLCEECESQLFKAWLLIHQCHVEQGGPLNGGIDEEIIEQLDDNCRTLTVLQDFIEDYQAERESNGLPPLDESLVPDIKFMEYVEDATPGATPDEKTV